MFLLTPKPPLNVAVQQPIRSLTVGAHTGPADAVCEARCAAGAVADGGCLQQGARCKQGLTLRVPHVTHAAAGVHGQVSTPYRYLSHCDASVGTGDLCVVQNTLPCGHTCWHVDERNRDQDDQITFSIDSTASFVWQSTRAPCARDPRQECAERMHAEGCSQADLNKCQRRRERSQRMTACHKVDKIHLFHHVSKLFTEAIRTRA